MVESNLQDKLRAYVEYICQNVSCHGGNWAFKIRSGKLKSCYLLVMVGFQFFVMSVVLQKLLQADDRGIFSTYTKHRDDS